MTDILKLLDEVEEYAGKSRALYYDVMTEVKKLRSESQKLKVNVARFKTENCRGCGKEFSRKDLDWNSFCKVCAVENDA